MPKGPCGKKKQGVAVSQGVQSDGELLCAEHVQELELQPSTVGTGVLWFGDGFLVVFLLSFFFKAKHYACRTNDFSFLFYTL